LGLGTVSTFGCPSADKIALNIGQAAEYRQHQAPDNAFDDAEEVKGAARQPVDPRYRHHVAEFEVLQHRQKLARAGPGGLSGAG
jgi:hypothetical protein